MPPHEPLPKLPVARAVWRRSPISSAAAAWILAGGPHHTGFSAALGTEAMVDFTEMALLELVRTDYARPTCGGSSRTCGPPTPSTTSEGYFSAPLSSPPT